MAATYDVRIDWNDDGDWSDTGEDVTSRALTSPRGGIRIKYGRDQVRALSPIQPGQASLTLDNTSRDYSPENSSSPIAANLLPSRPVRVQATLSAVTYTLYRGFTDEFNLHPGINDRTVTISCLDALARFKEVKLSTPLYSGVTTGTAIGYVLDAIGWPAADRDLDTGATTIRWWWEEGTDAFDALKKIVNSEGVPAFVYVDGDGNFVFRDRHHRITRTASKTSQATFRDTGSEPRFSSLTYDHGWRDVVNVVSFSVNERDPAGDLSVVWSSDRSYSIAAGQTIQIRAEASDPFTGAATPVSGTDYQLRSGAVTVSLSRTSGAAVLISILATSAAVIDSLQLRAYSVGVRRTFQVEKDDAVSRDRYGRRSYPEQVPWAGLNDAEAIADVILGQRAERLPIVTIRLFGNDTRLTQQLTRDLSDRITIIDADTGLNDEFYIEQIDHVISSSQQHETVFGCEKVPSTVGTPFTFDGTGKGFNDGAFGLTGLDDPATVFLFDHATQGKFDVGLFGF